MPRKKIRKNPSHGNAKFVWAFVGVVLGWALWQVCMVDGEWSPPQTFSTASYRLKSVIVGGTDDVNEDLKDRRRKLKGVVKERNNLNRKRVGRDLEAE